ncbi:hypothetical protein BGZ83_010355 [Gryganskiella cystojenkinii]|nr:hypothetical protein BGZ83_010355 [Gryganskiella cystojenkinii]
MNPHRVRKPTDELDETPAKYPSKFPPPSDGKTPYVIIVGAGIGGLFLAILLEKIGIRYEIFERASEVKPLGSIMAINGNILPVLEQLGIYEEFKKISLPSMRMNVRYGNLKKVAFWESTEDIREFDILVGADGAYSAVRQSLYKHLTDNNALPPSDAKEMHKGFTCLVGTTESLDPKKFDYVSKNYTEVCHMIGQGIPYTWCLFNVPDNKICWLVNRQFETEAECENEKFRNSEWGPEKSGGMIESVRDFKTPFGTLGDLIDHTPKEEISRVYLEDKVFETWTHGRTVLIGDAAHKMLPSGAQGAVNAMQDAVILANCLYDLKSLKQGDIEEALQDYREQRYDQVRIQNDYSNKTSFIFNGQTITERVVRYVILNWLPQSIKNKALIKDARYRPQLAFMPLAPKRGTVSVLPQKPSTRYEEEQRKKREEEERKRKEEEQDKEE